MLAGPARLHGARTSGLRRPFGPSAVGRGITGVQGGMTTLASGIEYVDLEFRGLPGVIATAIFHGPAGVAIVDPGPSTSLPVLRRSLAAKGMAIGDIRQILLTHIHLDHAGVSGSLVEENPSIEVFVHERGAGHLADPSRLLASAGRLYGEDMDRLWGAFLPVPAERLRPLKGEERIAAGGRTIEVAYTPGHASHHVSYFEPASGIAFVGDTGGIRRGSGAYVMPVTPPPDIDLEAWRATESRILAWNPDTLFVTHFGPYQGARPHFQQLMDRLAEWSRLARGLIADAALDEPGRQQRFVDAVTLDLRRAVGPAEGELYERAGSLAYSWQGLSRYWRKQAR
jgi:glyoxylase-like metal-dependent hydrolase (beta-lactamase superfamily II)